MIKYSSVFIWGIFALIAQIILSRNSILIRDLSLSNNPLTIMKYIVHIILFSGLSLIATFTLYRNFSFGQVIFAQSIFYIFATFYAIIILGEKYSFIGVIGMMLVLTGVTLIMLESR